MSYPRTAEEIPIVIGQTIVTEINISTDYDKLAHLMGKAIEQIKF
jgi:hypothetical protein